MDDGAEGAGPSAAPPVTAQDIMSSYAALILGTGMFSVPLATVSWTKQISATFMSALAMWLLQRLKSVNGMVQGIERA